MFEPVDRQAYLWGAMDHSQAKCSTVNANIVVDLRSFDVTSDMVTMRDRVTSHSACAPVLRAMVQRQTP